MPPQIIDLLETADEKRMKSNLSDKPDWLR